MEMSNCCYYFILFILVGLQQFASEDAPLIITLTVLIQIIISTSLSSIPLQIVNCMIITWILFEPPQHSRLFYANSFTISYVMLDMDNLLMLSQLYGIDSKVKTRWKFKNQWSVFD